MLYGRRTVTAVVVAFLAVSTRGEAVAFETAKQRCRLVALGDVHGDPANAKRALAAARLTDEHGTWTGGCSTLVQTGDLVDRGFGSLDALDYFSTLQHQAAEDGGKVVLLLGNHEIMNMLGDTGYVAPVELQKAGGADEWRKQFNMQRGKYGTQLVERPIVWNESGIIFVHAGILPEYAAMGVEAMNAAAKSNLKNAGQRQAKDDAAMEDIVAHHTNNMLADTGPTWTRALITEARKGVCSTVRKSLEAFPGRATKMVIGHTINDDGKIHEHCGGALLAIDVGMSRAIYGIAAAVEIDPATGGIVQFYADQQP